MGYKEFGDFCAALADHIRDAQTRSTIHHAIEEMGPTGAVATLVDAVASIAPDHMDPVPLDDAWATLSAMQYGSPCPFFIVMMHRSTGHYMRCGQPCGKSWCARCGVDRATGILDALRKRFTDCDSVWVAVMTEVDEAMRNRLNSRAHGRKASYAWVRRLNGPEIWFASRSLGGPTPPYLFTELKPPQAFLLLRISLLTPYWNTARATKDWTWPLFWKPKESTGEWKRIAGSCSDSTANRAEELLKQRVSAYVGHSTTGTPKCPPEGMPLAEWEALLQSCFQDAGAGGRD